MSAPTNQELVKLRKAADEFVTLSNEMKQNFVEEKIRTLNASIKKLLMKKDSVIEIFVLKSKLD